MNEPRRFDVDPTGNTPHSFTTIREAIDTASDGKRIEFPAPGPTHSLDAVDGIEYSDESFTVRGYEPRHIFVDPARGNDWNDGTNDSPLESADEAFARSVQQEGHVEVRDETGKLLTQCDVIPLRDDPHTPHST